MLTEGKERVSTYRVYFFHLGTQCCMDVKTNSAQEAVNHVRETYNANIGIITEVLKVVNNWK